MPTTVWAAALIRMDLPTTAGSRLNRRRQISSLSSTTWGAPGWSSSARKWRPRAGLTPRSGKRLAETASPTTRSGSSEPEKVMLRPV